MAKPGPRPRPPKVRQLHTGKLPPPVVQPQERPVEAPEWLRDNPVAMQEWDRLCPDLVQRQVVTHWDTQVLAEYCGAVARVAEATKHLADEGEIVNMPVFDRNGVATGVRPQRSMWAMVLRDALDTTARRSTRLGITPSERKDVNAVEPHVPSEADWFLS